MCGKEGKIKAKRWREGGREGAEGDGETEFAVCFADRLELLIDTEERVIRSKRRGRKRRAILAG